MITNARLTEAAEWQVTAEMQFRRVPRETGYRKEKKKQRWVDSCHRSLLDFFFLASNFPLSTFSEVPQLSTLFLGEIYVRASEVTENADVCKFIPVPMGV